jgi:hypothetical protein
LLSFVFKKYSLLNLFCQAKTPKVIDILQNNNYILLKLNQTTKGVHDVYNYNRPVRTHGLSGSSHYVACSHDDTAYQDKEETELNRIKLAFFYPGTAQAQAQIST